MRRLRNLALVASCFLLFVSTVNASNCESCGCNCSKSKLVKRTVMCPATVVETRMKSRVVYTNEQREEKYTAFERVEEKRQITKEVCYLEDEVKTKKIEQKNCKVVQVPVVRTCKCKFPQPEIRSGVRCREVCTECGCKICVEEPYNCEVVRMIDGVKSDNYCEPQLVFEKLEKDIFYCVKTPKKKKEVVCEEVVYKLKPVTKTRTVDVCVPKIVKEPCEVLVKKMVPKTIYCCEKCCHK